jgi:acetyl-CoA synthetase/medium-chain acyl-CoA synthetase
VSALQEGLDAYRKAVETFRWEVPDRFNFGRDVVDRLARDPVRPALLWRDAHGAERRLSFADIARGSDRVAHLFQALGIRPGQPAIVMLPRVPEWQIVIVGALKAGVLVIPSSTILRPKDIAYRAAHSGAVAIVTTREQTAAVDAVRADLDSVRHFLALDSEGAEGWSNLGAAIDAASDAVGAGHATRATDPALVYYTSGTTGPPKAVLHDHGYTHAQRYTTRFWHGARDGDRLWTTSDTGWAKAAYGVIFGPWSAGAEVFLAPQVFCAPPTEFRLLVKEDLRGLDASPLRECVSAGEPLNPEVIRAWREATGITIRDGYGQTETILLVGNLPGMPVRPGSMGLPAPGHRIEVIDEAGSVMPPGDVGDIAVHGRPPGLFVEYWKDAAATRACRRGEWYVTGDRDDVIISAGYRIGPFEVESALVEHPDVVEAAAVAAPDPDRGSIVKAFVVLRAGVRGDGDLARRLQEHVKRTTAPYKYPRAVEFVEALPKTVSGKIRRVDLRG